MSREEELTRAFRPALLADVLHVLTPLHQLHRDPTLPPDLRVRVQLRLADILRRFVPDEALALLERVDLSIAPTQGVLAPDTIRTAALLEAGRREEARSLLPFIDAADGVDALLRGRLAYLDGELPVAERAWGEAIAQTTSPEVRAEALGLRARLVLGLRRDASADLDQLEALCVEHGAGVTQTLVRLLRAMTDAEVAPIVAEGMARGGLSAMSARYCLGYEHLREQLSPIPVEVHGAARAHVEEPQQYIEAILAMSSLAWRIGNRLLSLEMASYGVKIGARLFGVPAMAPIRQLRSALLLSLPPVERDALEQTMSRRAAARRPHPTVVQ